MSGSAVLVDYQLPHVPLLSKQETTELSQRIAKGDQEAKNRMIEANMRLVVEIAKKYRCDHLDAEDLVQEGILGLMRAAEKFDPTLGYSFTTMATWWIQQAIVRAIDQFDRPIRIPTHLMENLRVVHKAVSRLQMELQRTPTDKELVSYTGKSLSVVQLVKSAPWVALSLDASVDALNTEADTYGDFIEDPGSNVEEMYIAHMNDERALLHRAIQTTLTPKEREVFTLYYGIDCKERVITQIAAHYNISKQRVQQLLAKARRKVQRAIAREGAL